MLAASALLFACDRGGEEPAGPRWIPLAHGFRPRELLPLAQRWQAEAGMDPSECREEEPWSVHVRHALPRPAWQPASAPDTWTTAMPGGAFAFGSPRFLRLDSRSQPIARGPSAGELRESSFRLERGQLVLRVAPGAEPPADLVLVQRMEAGRETAEGAWQVREGNQLFSGIAVWTGHPEEVACDLPAASRLSFEACYVTRSEGPVTLRVRLDGELVHEIVEPSSRLGERLWQSFVLPPRARPDARIAFEAEGPHGQALFLHPVVGPAEIGAPGARPWPAPRPDVVLFLADTFRADSLEHCGGASGLAPALDAFAADALRFPNARSNASWTLPSIAALLSGLAPGQHTANEIDSALPDELVTIVEELARAGYRTAAVTDAAFFAPTHGLEQGFESFAWNLSAHWDLDWTVRAALERAERDDGRPLFLVVHTYRTHLPYRVGPEEDLARWRELVASGCALLRTRGELPRAEWKERLAECRERYRELYREGVRDLDRGFGELLGGLEQRGLGRGYVIFTSDHGEALGENEDLFHDGKLWESKLRVPLVVRGPGLTPGDVAHGVTLLDVAPTLAEIAGLPRDPRRPGASLFSLRSERPACAFLLKKGRQVAVQEGGRKVFAEDAEALARGAIDAAYDLARDPHEDAPVTGEGWPAELGRKHADLVRALLEPAGSAVVVPLSGEEQQELGQLGYGGGDEDGDEDD